MLIVIYLALVVNLLGYVLWDTAARRGNITLVATAAYFIPLFSTLINAWLLRVWPTVELWTACGLIIAGAFICKLFLREPEVSGTEREIP